MKEETLKTGIYMRVSTEEQAREGFSIHAQKEKLSKYANANDWEIVDFYVDDGISGKNIQDRPDALRLIEDVKNGKVTNVLVYKLDRLTRSVKDLISLIELFESHECCFNSVTEKLDTSNAVGRMFIKIIGIFAEFERENLAERVSFGYEQKTREGNYTNTNGVNGYDYIVGSGDLVINEEERIIVERIYEEYLNGTSMLKIAKMLNTEKVPSKRGGYWSQSTIKSILTNPLYIGKIRYGVSKKLQPRAFSVDGTQDAIIDNDTFERVQNLIQKRKHFHTKKYPSENAFFSTVLKCSNCGASFHSKMQKQKGKYYITYYCNNKQIGKCNKSGISHIKVLNAFLEYIDNYKLNSNITIETNKKNDVKLSKIQTEIESIEKKRKRLQMLFINEEIDTNDYKEITEQLSIKKKELIDLLEEPQTKEEEINFDDIKEIIVDLKNNWNHLDTKEKYQFINQFVKTIYIDVIDGNAIIKEMQFY
jgi:site-specific DNA recombinase